MAGARVGGGGGGAKNNRRHVGGCVGAAAAWPRRPGAERVGLTVLLLQHGHGPVVALQALKQGLGQVGALRRARQHGGGQLARVAHQHHLQAGRGARGRGYGWRPQAAAGPGSWVWGSRALEGGRQQVAGGTSNRQGRREGGGKRPALLLRPGLSSCRGMRVAGSSACAASSMMMASKVRGPPPPPPPTPPVPAAAAAWQMLSRSPPAALRVHSCTARGWKQHGQRRAPGKGGTRP